MCHYQRFRFLFGSYIFYRDREYIYSIYDRDCRITVTGVMADRHPADLHLFSNYQSPADIIGCREDLPPNLPQTKVKMTFPPTYLKPGLRIRNDLFRIRIRILYFWIEDPDPTRVKGEKGWRVIMLVIASPPAKTTKLCLKIFSNKRC